ncbi:unnamed protein product [Phytophthora fragariaefolia]|uniref:Unnamed protein product n=1 Tax=Phytophthora fragariaefolia TaxID=1490495 RepID=A0A9W6WVJ3_9STRA|nr:unnamed protein product [Phytophthora fragariaefolia]
MSDGEDPTKHSTPADYDLQGVDYEPNSDGDASGSEETAKTSTTSKPPSPVRSFSQRTLQRRADQEKCVPLSSRRNEAQIKHFLMKTWTTRTSGWSRNLRRLTTFSKASAITTAENPAIIFGNLADLRDGAVKAGTVLPANFELRGGNSNRSHPYERRGTNSTRGRGSWKTGGRGRTNGGRGGNYRDNRKGHQQPRRDEGGYDQSHREGARIAVATVVKSIPPAISLTAQVCPAFDPTGRLTRAVAAAVEHDFRFTFQRAACTVQTDHRFNFKAKKSATTKLYQFTATPIHKQEAHVVTSGKPTTVMLLHKRLGHPNIRVLQALTKDQALQGLDANTVVPKDNFFCST